MKRAGDQQRVFGLNLLVERAVHFGGSEAPIGAENATDMLDVGRLASDRKFGALVANTLHALERKRERLRICAENGRFRHLFEIIIENCAAEDVLG